MRKSFLLGLCAVLLALSCRNTAVPPRPTIPLVHAVVADTAGLGHLPARAGNRGVLGSIAIIGDPADAILLARRFQAMDQVDNVDGRQQRDSLPDFAGEHFDVILDAVNAPYVHFLQEGAGELPVDSLREAAVRGALFAWDSTCFKSASQSHPEIAKQQAKILIFTSSLQARWGMFDVDTLQQLCGGRSRLLSPMQTQLADAAAAGATRLAVWTSREVRSAGVWEAVFAEQMPENASLQVLSPDAALDIRTEFRQLLRQYLATGERLDALLLDHYGLDIAQLQSELALIRRAGTEEDTSLSKMLAPDFRIIDPTASVIRATYELLRRENLFTHRIARPGLSYYETEESGAGTPVLVAVTASYIHSAYVPDFD